MRHSSPSARSWGAAVAKALGVTGARRLSLAALALWTANAAGGAAIVAALVLVSTRGHWLVLVPFLALASVAELMKVQILESNRERLSFTLTIVVIMAAVTVVPWGAPLAALVAGAIHTACTYKRGQIGKQLFKLTNTPLAAGLASALYLSLTGGVRRDGIAIDAC